MEGTASRPRGRLGLTSMASLALIGLQLISAIIILGLVGVRFNRASFSSAVFSIILSVITILSALFLAYLAFRPPQSRLIIISTFVWQVILVILWAAAAGTLGSHGNRSRSTGLRAAMALALIEMLTFVIGSVVGGLALWRGRRQTRKLEGGV